MESFFIQVSGEHPTLPHAEILAILEASGLEFETVAKSVGLLRLRSDLSAVGWISGRSLMFDFIANEMFVCASDREEIVDAIQGLDLSHTISPADRFSVRIKRKATTSVRPSISAGMIGEMIRNKIKAKVDLTNPTVQLIGLIDNDQFMFGKLVAKKPRRSVAGRLPRRRPAFHPSTMQPKLARAMVNLSRPPHSGIFLDPFCGVGGLLLEAGLIGCELLGVDRHKKMIRGARRNLSHYGFAPLGLVLGDAQRLPFINADAVAGDPPYGREASTGGLSTGTIVENTLQDVAEKLPKCGHVCFALPQTVDAQEIGQSCGFVVRENHRIPVHRSLTRQIVTFAKSTSQRF